MRGRNLTLNKLTPFCIWKVSVRGRTRKEFPPPPFFLYKGEGEEGIGSLSTGYYGIGLLNKKLNRHHHRHLHPQRQGPLVSTVLPSHCESACG